MKVGLLRPDKLNRSRIAALASRALSSGRDVYVVAGNNAKDRPFDIVRARAGHREQISDSSRIYCARRLGRDW